MHYQTATRRLCLALGIALWPVVLPVKAADGARDATLALNFTYTPTGTGEALANGYRKHLDWHTANDDPILWYAWFIVEGERLGYFVDGAYDVTGAEFDARPDPAADGRDGAVTFAPFAHPENRRVYRLRPDLGTSSFLEVREPSPLMQVVFYRVHPGRQRVFETAASSIAAAARSAEYRYTIYEMLTGATGALYAMYVPLEGFASFDGPATSLELVAQLVLGGTPLDTAMDNLARSARETEAEVWQYRPDLSLLPDTVK